MTFFWFFSLFSSSKALLETSEPIIFSKTVQPICISSTSISKNKTYVGSVAHVSGWGNLMEEFAAGNHTVTFVFRSIYFSSLKMAKSKLRKTSQIY